MTIVATVRDGGRRTGSPDLGGSHMGRRHRLLSVAALALTLLVGAACSGDDGGSGGGGGASNADESSPGPTVGELIGGSPTTAAP